MNKECSIVSGNTMLHFFNFYLQSAPSFLRFVVAPAGRSGDGGGGGGGGLGCFCCPLELEELFWLMDDLLETDFQDNSELKDNPELKDNSELIYEHAEKSIERANKSIDNVTSKLTSSLGFSGLLLKFAADMPSESYLFFFKVFVTLLLMSTIALCGSGLYTKAAGEDITTHYLRFNLYYEPSEKVRRIVIDQRLKAIEQLEKLAVVRRMFLNYAITCLLLAVTVFGGSIIVQAFLKAAASRTA